MNLWGAIGSIVAVLGFFGTVGAVLLKVGRWQEQHHAMAQRLDEVESGQTEILKAHSDLKEDLRELKGTINGLTQAMDRFTAALVRREGA